MTFAFYVAVEGSGNDSLLPLVCLGIKSGASHGKPLQNFVAAVHDVASGAVLHKS